MAKGQDEALRAFLTRAKANYGKDILQITLFGSHARKKAGTESDIDLLVVWNGRPIEGWTVLEQLVADILIEYGVLLSLKLISPQDLQSMIDMDTPFIREIKGEGIPLIE